MRDYLEIVPFGESDLDFAASCTAAEGWISETREEFESFLEYDRKGCLVARQSGEPVGICVATSYVEWGFIGELIVLPESRGNGIGRRLLDHAIAYLRARGASSVCLDGVVSALELYERAGFRRVCRSLRFTGEIQGEVFPCVRAMQTEDMDACLALDAAAFGADRASFLQRRQALHSESCRVLEIDGQVRGFIMARARQNGLVIGPWVVRNTVPRCGTGALLVDIAQVVGPAGRVVPEAADGRQRAGGRHGPRRDLDWRIRRD